MHKLALTCGLVGAVLSSLVLAVAPSHATFRGANGLLVYQAQVGKHVQLFTIRPSGSGVHQLTHFRDSDAIEASWSPDGERIAFARDYALGTPREHLDIFTMNADGSDLHGMGLRGLNGAPTWSPGGEIVWLHPGGFATSNADGSRLRMIRVPGDNGSLAFSPTESGLPSAVRSVSARGPSSS